VAALTVDAAYAARQESRRLCSDSSALRLAARQNLLVAAARRERAETVAIAATDAQAPASASPWSELLWSRPDDDLNRVLVAVA